jgi:hypothetical protein
MFPLFIFLTLYLFLRSIAQKFCCGITMPSDIERSGANEEGVEDGIELFSLSGGNQPLIGAAP